MLHNKKSLTLGIVVWVACLSTGQAQTPELAQEQQVAELIRKLGSSSFVQRERARKDLESIGTFALEALRKASKSPDFEIRMRALELIARFEEQILTRQVLTPKEIHLKLVDVEVPQAIAELAKISGYQITFIGAKETLAGKKITLDTGKTTFWQALDQLCAQAGLNEKIEAAKQVWVPSPNMFRVRRQVEIYAAPPPTPAAINLVAAAEESAQGSTSYTGAVKTKLWIKRDLKTKGLCATFSLSAEPRLLNSSLAAEPEIAKAIDQEGRDLSVHIEGDKNGTATALFTTLILTDDGLRADLKRQVDVHIKDGGREPKQIKELSGKLIVRLALANERLARIDQILEGSGRSTNGANGGTLKVTSVRKIDDSNGQHAYEVQVVLDNLTTNPLGGNVDMINGNVVIQNIKVQNIGFGGLRGGGINGDYRDLPDLLDARGQKYRITHVDSDGVNIFNGSFTRTATILYQANPDQAAPTELVLFGTRNHTITVPFRFENVPIP